MSILSFLTIHLDQFKYHNGNNFCTSFRGFFHLPLHSIFHTDYDSVGMKFIELISLFNEPTSRKSSFFSIKYRRFNWKLSVQRKIDLFFLTIMIMMTRVTIFDPKNSSFIQNWAKLTNKFSYFSCLFPGLICTPGTYSGSSFFIS